MVLIQVVIDQILEIYYYCYFIIINSIDKFFLLIKYFCTYYYVDFLVFREVGRYFYEEIGVGRVNGCFEVRRLKGFGFIFGNYKEYLFLGKEYDLEEVFNIFSFEF